jgi:cytochrome c peroxidase
MTLRSLFAGAAALGGTLAIAFGLGAAEPPLGLPAVPVPADNPMTPAKVALGDRLFHDPRFSATGEVSCATCHAREKAFTDSPLQVSEGINKLTGTRNAPTVLNAAFNQTQFWDGREPDLEGQSGQPFLNPVEMALPSHQPILDIVKADPEYREMVKAAFGIEPDSVTALHVKQAIASFERTLVTGDSPFDRWYFGGQEDAIDAAAKRGFQVFLQEGRCVSCHTLNENHAVFTDHKFHNINVGFLRIEGDVYEMASAYAKAARNKDEVDIDVLTNKNTSELGRFAVDNQWAGLGAFKTPTLRNIAVTAPYMHDGSLKDLEEVVKHYNNGGALKEGDPINPYLSGGIRPLNLSDEQVADLVAFMKTLTSPEYADLAGGQ